MRKYIISALLTLSLLGSVFAKKSTLDYNQLSLTASDKELKIAYKSERSLFYKSYYENKETFLHLCLKNNRSYEIIKLCIDYEADVNARTKDGRNTISYAAQYSSDPKIIELLVKTNALTSSKKRRKILQTDDIGKNSFHYSKENLNTSIYSKLCEFTEDPNIYDSSIVSTESETTTLVDDISAVEAELAKEAAELESMTYKEPVKESTELIVSTVESTTKNSEEIKENIEKKEDVAVVKDEEEINALVEKQKTDLKKQEVETYVSAFLLDYAEEPEEKIVKEKDIKIENPNLADKNGVTLLMKAAKAGNDWDVRTLLANGADVNLRDKDGWSALMYAARYQNNLNIINMLIEKGAYVRVRNKYNATPLLMAADYSKNPEILYILLKNRTVAEDEVFRAFILTITGKTNSSHICAAKVKIFLDMNIPLNRLWKGQTPLMFAAQYSSTTEILQELLDAGADHLIVNEKGLTAFDYAKNNKKLPKDNTFWALNSVK